MGIWALLGGGVQPEGQKNTGGLSLLKDAMDESDEKKEADQKTAGEASQEVSKAGMETYKPTDLTKEPISIFKFYGNETPAEIKSIPTIGTGSTETTLRNEPTFYINVSNNKEASNVAKVQVNRKSDLL